MAPTKDPSAADESRSQQSDDPLDMAQAYKELARGEQTAAALEANLTTLESKLDAMLAALDAAEGAQGNSVVAAAAGDKDPKTEAEKKSS